MTQQGTYSSGGLRTSIKVGAFLAWRDIKRASKWTTALIVVVMTLTFLNLIVVSGILVGIIEGAVVTIREAYLGDIFISTHTNRPYIDQSPRVLRTAEGVPGVLAATGRYVESGQIESDWQTSRRPTDRDNAVGTSFAGIDPAVEERVTNLSDKVVEGRYLEKGDFDQVLLGALLLDRYLQFESPTFPVLKDVQVGDRIRITINNQIREVTVKGVLRTKADEIDRRLFMTDIQLRAMIGRTDQNVDEIALKLEPGVDPFVVKRALIANGLDTFARVQTAEEGEPKFIKDMKQTFATLGNVIGSIGLVVAAITIFIIIFVNAITRRRFIGILKGIGITHRAIEASYILQSFLYASAGVLIGSFILFAVLVPFFQAHPIPFPFSDGILVATPLGAIVRGTILMFTTMIAGYIPARLITKQNTLDAILGR